ncbi:hypothetical protein BSKO_11322 [Bryopsis sp. KO-2023]|nr:hypothetical protein BSKO_11322 [Bryopsis sp. KO-2023]
MWNATWWHNCSLRLSPRVGGFFSPRPVESTSNRGCELETFWLPREYTEWFSRNQQRCARLGVTNVTLDKRCQSTFGHSLSVLPRILMNPYNHPWVTSEPEFKQRNLEDAIDEIVDLLEGGKASVKSDRGSEGLGADEESEGAVKQSMALLDILETFSDVSQILDAAMDILESDSMVDDQNDGEELVDDLEEYIEYFVSTSQDRTQAWVIAHALPLDKSTNPLNIEI